MTGAARKLIAADVEAWRVLTVQVGRAVDDPTRADPALQAAEKRARQAVVFGVVSRDNDCIRLVRLVRQFCGETIRGRRALVEDLLDVSARVGGQVAEALAPHPPLQRRRRDIFDQDED